jgi:hypothetical protein
MVMTDAGTMMLVRPALSKAPPPMLSSRLPLPKFTLIKAEQSAKAVSPMAVTEIGTSTLVRPALLKADVPMLPN